MTTMIRRKSNRIDCLKLENGEWIYSRNQIGNLFSARFAAVFDSPFQPLSCNLSNFVDPVITEEDNADLLCIPTWEEPSPTRVNHYRPISVCNVAYRVITKIIANRLKPLLNKLICPTQNAFVPGRSIHDNSVLVQEAIHSMKKKKGSLGWMALKIDLEKAYDRVSWSFIKEVLVAFGFDARWVGWIYDGNTRGAIASQLTDFLEFERIPMDSCYLGLPLFRSSKKNDFNFLVDCLDTKLAGWKSRLLSKASRLTLIKSVALAMPIYAMHTAKIPKAICAHLYERATAAFSFPLYDYGLCYFVISH
ncbi:hypothetical protein UlMin_006306 [Ulmus minor]